MKKLVLLALLFVYAHASAQSKWTMPRNILREAGVINHAICHDSWQDSVYIIKRRYLFGRTLFVATAHKQQWYKYKKRFGRVQIWIPKSSNGEDAVIKVTLNRRRIIRVSPAGFESKLYDRFSKIGDNILRFKF